MPVQRIPRYVLLLKDFLRNTPEDHDDHGNVSKALADMQQVAAYIEKKKEESENIYHIMAIQDSLEGKFSVPLLLSFIFYLLSLIRVSYL